VDLDEGEVIGRGRFAEKLEQEMEDLLLVLERERAADGEGFERPTEEVVVQGGLPDPAEDVETPGFEGDTKGLTVLLRGFAAREDRRDDIFEARIGGRRGGRSGRGGTGCDVGVDAFGWWRKKEEDIADRVGVEVGMEEVKG
jgi:hypothetical protein